VTGPNVQPSPAGPEEAAEHTDQQSPVVASTAAEQSAFDTFLETGMPCRKKLSRNRSYGKEGINGTEVYSSRRERSRVEGRFSAAANDASLLGSGWA